MISFLKNKKILLFSGIILAAFIVGFFLFLKNEKGGQANFSYGFEVKNSAEAPIKAESNESAISLQPEGVSSVAESKESGESIFKDIFKEVDLKRKVDKNILQEKIILKSSGHQKEFKYKLNRGDLAMERKADGSIVFYDKDKNGDDLYKKFVLGKPVLSDAKGRKNNDPLIFKKTGEIEGKNEGLASSSGRVEMKAEDKQEVVSFDIRGDELIIKTNDEWLKGATYPVELSFSLEINIINVHSHPAKGDNWVVSFTTKGKADLRIEPMDQATVDDDEFASLSCDGRLVKPDILKGDIIHYADWQCDGVGQVVHYTKKAGQHRLRFVFGGAEAIAYNSSNNWGITFNNNELSLAINSCRAMGGVSPDIDNMIVKSVSVRVAGTHSSQVRVAVYAGGSLSTGPSGASLLYDFGTTSGSATSTFLTLSHPGNGFVLPKNSVIWIAVKGNDSGFYIAQSDFKSNAGYFQTATGRYSSAVMSFDESASFPTTWTSDGGSFYATWDYLYLSYDLEGVSATTSDVSAITSSSANLNGSLDIGSATSNGVFFNYGTSTTSYSATTTSQSKTASSSFNSVISNLSSLTPYYYRAVATSTLGYYYGQQGMFYTADVATTNYRDADFDSGSLSNVTSYTNKNSQSSGKLLLNRTCQAYSTSTDSFEADFGNWSTAGGDFNWTRLSGSTPSDVTGPDSAQSGSYYAYTEASDPNNPKMIAYLERNMTGYGRVDFYYHMYGADMGTLEFQIYDGSSWTTVWSKNGNQGNQWSNAIVDFSWYENISKVRFKGTTGGTISGDGWASDMAVDNISLATTSCTYASSGYRLDPPLNLSNINNFQASKIEWGASTSASTTISIKTAISASSSTEPVTWNTVSASGDSIAGLNTSDNLGGKYLWVREDLSTSDTNYTPKLDWIAYGLTTATSGPVEFVSVVNLSGGAGSDYTSLAAWETAVQSDLTATSTKVFSHGGITGAIADGASVTGATSGATATAVHVTATQVLLKNIVGVFQSGEQVRVDVGNYVTISNAGNSAIAVAKCRAANTWTVEQNVLVIDGWTTNAVNYIKIWTDPSEGYRHNGNALDNEYNYTGYTFEIYDNNTIAITVKEKYTIIDGLIISGAMADNGGIYIDTNDGDYSVIKNCVFYAIYDSYSALYVGDNKTAYIYNNVFIDQSKVSISSARTGGQYVYAYNNTFYNTGLEAGSSGLVVAKNNLAYNNEYNSTILDCFTGTYSSSSTNNLSNDITAPGSNSLKYKIPKFYDRVYYSDIFNSHLDPEDTEARDKGADLSGDIGLPIGTDIDLDIRDSDGKGWDIGADEIKTQIYRSVGPANTTALATGASNALTISSTTAYFASSLATNIGVGDAIQYDKNNDSTVDSIVFITKRNSPTSFVIRKADSSLPDPVVSDTDWSIFRAYTSLANAETGTENTGINSSLRDFDTWSGGKNLASSSQQWNIACYKDAVDTTQVTVDGWVTDYKNYLRIYTPYLSSEVGVSQRHDGATNSGYYLTPSTAGNVFTLSDDYVRVEGLEIKNWVGVDWGSGTAMEIKGNTDFVAWNYIHENSRTTDSYFRGIVLHASSSNSYVYSNIIKNVALYVSASAHAMTYGGTGNSLFNNTIYLRSDLASGNNYGMFFPDYTTIYNVRNNISFGYASGKCFYLGTGSTYYFTSYSNLSSDNTAPGSDSIKNQTLAQVSFLSTTAGSENLHLGSNSTARDAGDILLYNHDIFLDDDVDGQARGIIKSWNWDIGADEVGDNVYRSVGNTSADLNTSSRTISVYNNGYAVFSGAMPDNVGVGDAIQYSANGKYRIVFIVGRYANNQYEVRSPFNEMPDMVKVATTSVYRAFLELNDWQTQTVASVNPAIHDDLDDYVVVGRDLVASNSAMMVPCYQESSIDDAPVTITSWTTANPNYIKIYTPTSTNEVGVTQRHSGKPYDVDGAYTGYTIINSATNYKSAIGVENSYVKIDGLLLLNTRSGDYAYPAISFDHTSGIYGEISNCIGVLTNNSSTVSVFDISDYSKVYNTIAIGNGVGNCFSFSDYPDDINVYNATAYNCTNGFKGNLRSGGGGSRVTLTNCLVASTTTAYASGELQNSEFLLYNSISNDGTADDFGGSGNFVNKTVSFVNATSSDLHLVSGDIVAVDLGTSSPSSVFSTDIDGNRRTTWDIGADEASIEFVAGIKESGGDYSSLSAWETAIQSDLTSGGTKVFSHGGITGAITDGASVTGATSGATATVVHATTTQIMLKSISGTFVSGEQVRVNVSNYVTIFNNGNPVIATARIEGTWTNPDTTRVIFNGWTTGEYNYINVYATGTARHAGAWSNTAYRLQNTATGDYQDIFRAEEDFVKVGGLQVELLGAYSTNGFVSYNLGPRNRFSVYGNIIKSDNLGYHSGIGAYSGTYTVSLLAWNNIIYNLSGLGMSISNTKSFFYNNTVFRVASYGILSNGGTTVKNNIAFSSGNGYDFANGFGGGIKNASSDGSANQYGLSNGTTTQIASNHFVSIATGSEDLHLKSTSSLIGMGASLSGDTALNFLNDIDSQARDASWDIGADEYVATNLAPTISSTTDTPDPVYYGGTISFGVNWTDADNDGVKSYICKTNSFNSSTFTCDGGSWCTNSGSFSTTTPLSCTYATVQGDTGNQNYYGFICDEHGLCSTGTAGTFKVDASPAISSISDLPDLVNYGENINFSVGWSDANGDSAKMFVCKTNSIATSTLTCDGGSWCTNSASWSASTPLGCSYTTQQADVGTKNYYIFVCDDFVSCSVASSSTFVVNSPPTVNSAVSSRNGNNVSFSVDWADTDNEGVKMLICKTNSIATSTLTCNGGSWCTNTGSWGTNTPVTCDHTIQVGENSVYDYYAFVCDDTISCSAGYYGIFNIERKTKIIPGSGGRLKVIPNASGKTKITP